MVKKLRREHILIESTRVGCMMSFGLTCITAAIASVLIVTFVTETDAWRRRPLFSETASISIFAAAVIGFIIGFVIEFRRRRKAR
jgi:ABC-type Mn2+/Zn2+ transport system permease subunit